MSQQELFTEHKILTKLNSLSLSDFCHVWPILATISLFSSTKPPKWPRRSRTLWLGLHLRSYIHSCRLPSNPSTACFSAPRWAELDPCLSSLVAVKEKQKRIAGGWFWLSWVCAENSNLSNILNHPEASRNRAKPVGEWSRGSAQRGARL